MMENFGPNWSNQNYRQAMSAAEQGKEMGLHLFDSTLYLIIRQRKHLTKRFDTLGLRIQPKTF